MNIAIIGAGIGGLSTAIALKLAGFDVAVYERGGEVSDIGAGIVCWPNASFVLEELGVLDKVSAVSSSVKSMRRFTSEGEAIGLLNINRLSKLMGYPSYAVLRKDLMKILNQRSIDLGINVFYNHNAKHLAEIKNDKAEVLFENNKHISADIILGADGRMNSIARKFILKNHKPIYQGFINWIGVFESNKSLFSERSVLDFWGVGERFGIVPVSDKKAYWAGGVASEKLQDKNRSLYKMELNSVFKTWSKLIANIIDKTPTSSINKIYVHDHNPIQKWYKNNVLLIGDAAHAPLPTSGQGACQALEDAWHLANCLKDNNADIEQVFSQFSLKRMNKTSGITIGGRQLASSIFNSDPEFCSQRNIISKQTNYAEAVNGMAKGWSSGLPMKTYSVKASL